MTEKKTKIGCLGAGVGMMLLGAGGVVLAALASGPVYQWLIEEKGISELTVGSGLMMQRIGLKDEPTSGVLPADPGSDAAPEAIELDASIQPFRNIGDQLGPRAEGHDFFAMRGGTIFDANGDDIISASHELERTLKVAIAVA